MKFLWSRRAVLRGAALAGAVAFGPAMALGADGETPVRGGTIVVSADVQPRSLDPVKGNAPTGDRYTFNHIYDTLLKMNVDGSIEPNLAESWEYVDDNLGLVLHLREGITFHDGTPFNAEAVKINIERTINPDTKSLKASDLAGVTGVEVIDDLTAKIVFDSVNASVLASLAVESGMMSSPKALASMSLEDYGLHPVGTGPFVFKEWVIGSHVDMVRNENYWRDGADGKPLPYADAVRVRYIANTAVKMVEVQAGSLHLADAVSTKDFALIDENPDLVPVRVPPGIVQWIAFNTQRPPMTDARVRKAFSMAIDRQFILDLVAEGYGEISRGPVSPSGWDYDPSMPPNVDYDPEGARKLLAEAGFPDGLDLQMLVVQRDPDRLIGQVLQQQLAEAGIRVQIESPDRSAMPPIRAAGKWDVFQGRVNVPRPDPNQLYGMSFSRTATSQNFSFVQDEEMFAETDAGRVTIDRAERKKHYLRVQEILYEQSYYAYIFFREVRHVARKELKGLTFDANGAWDLAPVWLEK